jgi:hypothetical protein
MLTKIMNSSCFAQFDFEQLVLGPVSGSQIGVSIVARIPEALPVDVQIRRPMVVEILYVLPARVTNSKSTSNVNAAQHASQDTSQSNTSLHVTKEYLNQVDYFPVLTDGKFPDYVLPVVDTEYLLPVGTADMNDESLRLSSRVGDQVTMNITMNVGDPVAFGRMVDHLLAFTSNKDTVVGIDQRNYSEPVRLQVNVLVSAVDVLIFNTPMLTIPNLSVQKRILLKGIVPKEEYLAAVVHTL